MNHTLIDKINRLVGKDDVLWYLGDFLYGRENNPAVIEYWRNRINCQTIHFIYGNHDKLIKKSKYLQSLFTSFQRSWIGQINNRWFFLTHLPPDEENIYECNLYRQIEQSYSNLIYLHGHTHNNSHLNWHNMSVENTHYQPTPLIAVLCAADMENEGFQDQ
jgi:calcineurin-like phosphoesterase family protein